MIKTSKSVTEMHGSDAELMADFTVIVHSLYFNLLIESKRMTPDEAKRKIMEQMEYGMMTEEQLERVHDAMKAEAWHGLLGMLNAMAEDLKKAAEDVDDNNA